MPSVKAKITKDQLSNILKIILAAMLAATLSTSVCFAQDNGGSDTSKSDASNQETTSLASDITIDPDATRPNWNSEWSGYTNGGNASTTVKTPTGKAKASWTFDYANFSGSQWASCSEPILAGDYVYIAVNNKLAKIEKSTGKVAKEAALDDSISYTSRPVYTNGLIVVPLNGGSVQALTADNLTTTWLTEKVNADSQASCTTTVDGDYVYVGSGTFSYKSGCLQKINTNTGEIAWQIKDENDGFYWNGTGTSGDCIIISTANGLIRTINRNTGSVVSTLDLKTALNTDCIMSSNDHTSYMIAKDGRLIIISLDKSGKITSNTTKNIGLSGSACTPTIADNNLFVGGEVDNGSTSALSIVNLTNYSYQTIKTADGASLLGGGIKAAPLVSKNDSGTFVYFTVNNAVTTDWTNYTAGGGVYSYKLGDSDSKLIYDPAGHYQYCDSPVICDSDGNLYYINDSGTLFKLTSSEESKSDDSDKKDDSSDDKKDDSSSKSDTNNNNSKNNSSNTTNKKNNNNSKSSAQTTNNSSNYSSDDDDDDYYYDGTYYYYNSDEDDSDGESSSDDNSDSTDTENTTDTSNSNNNDIDNQPNSLAGLNKNNELDISKASASPTAENNQSKFWWIPYLGIGVGIVLIGGSAYLMQKSRKKK